MIIRGGGHTAFALLLLALNAVYASQLVGMSAPFARGEPGPSFLPWLLCGFLFVAGLRILLAELRRAPEPDLVDRDAAQDTIRRLDVIGPAVVGVLTVAFIAAFPHLGYAVSTAVYVFAIALFFNMEQTGRWGASILWALLTAAAVTAFGRVFFVEVFDLWLPGWSL